MPLGNETLEGTLIEHIDESLTLYHLLKFTEQGDAIFCCHLLEADTLANSFLDAAHFTDFYHTIVGVYDNLDFFVA